ncbi:MAG: hypothetical protein JWN62_2349 [Acidimicrobiales bacterium]|nr:hypothetical protein [Acidimicrobiales bacterium]
MKRALPLLLVGACPLLGGCVVATSSSDGRGGGSYLFLFLPFLLFFLAFRSLRHVRRRGRSAGLAAPVTQRRGASVDTSMIRAELSVLADDALRLEPQVVLHDAARNDYESAVHRYRVAQAAVEQHASGAQIDLTRVQRVVDEAMWSMSRAQAVVQGYPPPAPPVELQRSGPSGEPAIRVAEDNQPVYVDAPVSFRSGWFAGGGRLLGALMLGGFGGWVVHHSDDSNPDDDVYGS